MPNAMLPPLFHDRKTWAAFSISISSVFLLTGYDMVRSPSNTLFKAEYGASGLTWVLAAAPVALLFLLYLYGKTLTRFGPRRTLHATLIASALGIATSFALIHHEIALGAALLILIREAYAVLVIEQYWSFLNSTLDEPTARRLNGPVTGISSLGGVLGGFLVATFGHAVSPQAWLLWGLVPFVPCLFFAEVGYRIGGEPKKPSAAVPKPKLEPNGKRIALAGVGHRFSSTVGLQLFKQHPLLVLLFGVILCTQVAATALDIHFQTLLQIQIPDANAQTAFSGRVFMWLNAASFGIQFLVAPLWMRWFSLRSVQICIPILNLCVIGYCWNSPTLFTAGAAFLVFKAMDYSIFRASKEMLYIPFSFDVRYRAKEVIDAFGYRFGKGGASLSFFLLKRLNVALTPLYLPVAFVATGAWLVLTCLLFYNKDHERLPRESVPK
jgi:ATP:ADP antiporter, AAA family